MLGKAELHMPKEAARIWLIVTDVRVERLQTDLGPESVNMYLFPPKK